MLNIRKGDRLKLFDGTHHELGVVVVGSIDGNAVCGDFVQTENFNRVKHLFEKYERLANKNKKAYRSMLQVEAEIAALAMHAKTVDEDEMEVYDVEIWHNNFALIHLRLPMVMH
jgi:hypothetical protein